MKLPSLCFLLPFIWKKLDYKKKVQLMLSDDEREKENPIKSLLFVVHNKKPLCVSCWLFALLCCAALG